MSVAFVIGNGISRAEINLSNLKKYGKTYGCNALYREFSPDYLIAVDAKMIIEINESRYQFSHEVWTNYNKAYEKMTGLNYFSPSKGWSSGPTALWLASEHSNKEIYILGFDYQGTGEGNNLVNNLYAGTPNYKRVDERATYFGNWLKQTLATIQKHPHKRYIRVITDNCIVPKDFANIENLTHMPIENFKKIVFKTC